MQIYVAFAVKVWRIGCLNLGKILLKFGTLLKILHEIFNLVQKPMEQYKKCVT